MTKILLLYLAVMMYDFNPALRRQQQEDLRELEPCLQSEFQVNHGYSEKPCFEKQNKGAGEMAQWLRASYISR